MSIEDESDNKGLALGFATGLPMNGAEVVSAVPVGIPSAETFVHCAPKDTCEHDFKGWREFDDGLGGETVCAKCGMGAMAWTLSLDI